MDIKADILGDKLITVPAAPAFIENKNNPLYYKAIRSSTFNIIDSGLFAILCRLKGIKVNRYSGYELILDLVQYLKANKIKLFIISPSEVEKENITNFFSENTLLNKKDLGFYVAPFYPKNQEITDDTLKSSIENFSPDIVLICIAGGKQEILGNYLKTNLAIDTSILCTGAAISFFTGSQAKISPLIDRLYLGWLARTISNPKVFLPRYFNALKFFIEFFRYKIKVVP